jgi:hypothetical protein
MPTHGLAGPVIVGERVRPDANLGSQAPDDRRCKVGLFVGKRPFWRQNASCAAKPSLPASGRSTKCARSPGRSVQYSSSSHADHCCRIAAPRQPRTSVAYKPETNAVMSDGQNAQLRGHWAKFMRFEFIGRCCPPRLGPRPRFAYAHRDSNGNHKPRSTRLLPAP